MRRFVVSIRLEVPPLQGSLVRLEPLSMSHRADLAAAAEEDRSGYGWTGVPRAEQVPEFILGHLARADEGLMVPTLGVVRLDLATDARNVRSREAITGLGARFEGVLRNWSPSYAPGEEGMLRDSALFSVTAPEWPSVKASLARRLQRRGSVAYQVGALGGGARGQFDVNAGSATTR
jgi:hypothetical protein